jgi:hypothetical protein
MMIYDNYDCCAVCDRGMVYNSGDAEMKEMLCSDCASVLSTKIGRSIDNTGQFIEWLKKIDPDDPDVLLILIDELIEELRKKAEKRREAL